MGHLWYLNVHSSPSTPSVVGGEEPYIWQKCTAVLYPHMLLLSWIAPGGGRGIVSLDLVNCVEVRSVPSPTRGDGESDVGTRAARRIGGELLDILCPFQLLYSDGVERLGAESARERVRWVGAIW